MENIPDRVDSKFRFVLLSAARAEQMIQGASAKAEAEGKKVTRIAMNEIASDAIEWDYGPAPEPEVEDADEDATAEQSKADES